MAQYFVVNHKKLGFVICFLVPIMWIVMLWDSKRIRKGIVLIVVMESTVVISAIVAGILASSSDLIGLAIISLMIIIGNWLWWRYYWKCVEVLELKNKGNQDPSLNP